MLVPQQDFTLLSVNMKGMALVDGCLDKLSHDSGRIKISTWRMPSLSSVDRRVLLLLRISG